MRDLHYSVTMPWCTPSPQARTQHTLLKESVCCVARRKQGVLGCFLETAQAHHPERLQMVVEPIGQS